MMSRGRVTAAGLALAALALAGCNDDTPATQAGQGSPSRAPAAPAASASATPTPTSAPTPAPTAAHRTKAAHPGAVVVAGVVMPDRRLTPGATFPGVTAAQVCTPGWSSAHRHVTLTERHQVFAAYHIPYAQHSRYELDHLIALELGGNNATRNLWPEPNRQNDAHGPDKDALENHLHALVCAGQLKLSTAQHAIAANWVAAWKRYEPVPARSPIYGAHPTPHATSTHHAAPPQPAPQTTVHPGAFCAPEGAHGVTSRGTPMVCGTTANSPDRARWHAAQ